MSFKGGGGVNQFAAMAIQEYMKHNMCQHIDDQNRSLRVKRDAMLASLGENFGDAATWSVPEGGLYTWLRLPEGADLAGLEGQVFAEGVGYYAGIHFSPEGLGATAPGCASATLRPRWYTRESPSWPESWNATGS